MTIDWSFIGGLEGRSLNGYVPDPDKSRSGVTIATGVDLGNMTLATFSLFSEQLKDVLRPYLGKLGWTALELLKASPLTISEEDADEIDEIAHQATITTLTVQYNRYSHVVFSRIPDAAQTVACSVAFQYGSLLTKCPKLWAMLVTQNWSGAIHELENFGDDYKTRRNKEAAYLAAALGESTGSV